MSTDRDREDRALDALIAAAFWREECDDTTLEDLERLKAALGPDDRAALAGLGDNLGERITAGEWTPRAGSAAPGDEPASGPCGQELAGAMHRGGEGLTDVAREEMERKLRESEGGEEGEADDEPGGGHRP